MTVIAVTNSYTNNVTILPPAVAIKGLGDCIIHDSPNLEFDGSSINKNFDYHLDFSLNINRLHAKLLPDHYFHFPRHQRMDQYINIHRFNSTRETHEQLFVPKFYLATAKAGEHLTVTNFGIPTQAKLVIKSQMGARGSNQIVLPSNMLVTLLKYTKGLKLGEVREKFPDLIYSDGSDWEEIFFDKPNELFISELVPGVKQEWRLLIGGDKIYGRERVIKQGPYPQANLETSLWNNIPTVIYEPIDKILDPVLVQSIQDFVKFIKLPLGSLDLFLTTEGQYGLFEYSPQYAFHGADPLFIRQLHVDAISHVLSNRRSMSNRNSTSTKRKPKSVIAEKLASTVGIDLAS